MLVERGYDPKMGARPIARKIDELIKVPLSKKLLFDRLSDCSIFANIVDDKVDFSITHNTNLLPTIDSNGVIIM
jgi:ATP-dependent Clp protease ATP-binding subunit ClpA